MSTLRWHPAYVQVADLIDAVGRRYRFYLLLRGMILFFGLAVLVGVPAALGCSWLGPGWMTGCLAVAAGIAVIWGFGVWLARPLLFRPGKLGVARLIEERIPGMHNGLSNLLLLGRAEDLAGNPWIDQVFREIAETVAQKPLKTAVDFRELSRFAVRMWAFALPMGVVGVLMAGTIAQGFSQMARPGEFVPATGAVELLEVIPGKATVIKGGSLEVTVRARGAGDFAGQIWFEGDARPVAMSSTASATQDGERLFAFRRERVDESTRYLVEIGGTQSPWYVVKAIRQVTLRGVRVAVTPPTYTRAKPQTMTLAPEEIGREPLVVPQGSNVEMAFDLDIPVAGGMLQVGEVAPAVAKRLEDGRQFSAGFGATETATVSLLLTDGGGQIIARVPENPLMLQVAADLPPAVEMKWPVFDLSVTPMNQLRVVASLRDDYGLTAAKLLWSASPDGPMQTASEERYAQRPTAAEFAADLQLPNGAAAHGKSVWVQVEASDGRDLLSLSSELGPQTTQGKRVEIRFRDAQQLAREQAQKSDRLHEAVVKMLEQQRRLHESAMEMKIGDAVGVKIQLGQGDLKSSMLHTARTFEFSAEQRVIQKTLQILAGGAAQEAVEFAAAIATEREVRQHARLGDELKSRQRRVIQTLESLLTTSRAQGATGEESGGKRAGDLRSPAEAMGKMAETLKEFVKEEQRILDQTRGLSKRPAGDFNNDDKKRLEELKLAQEKLDASMQQKVNDSSDTAGQDMANWTKLRERLEVNAEVTMASDALREQAVEMAISHEETGLELAKEITTDLEKRLLEQPDRLKWTPEDQLQRPDVQMADLPEGLQDRIGELMKEQENLFDQIENAKGAGAVSGPNENMAGANAAGNEMDGRAGEGRSDKTQGELAKRTASRVGGRNAPKRAEATASANEQIGEESADSRGRAPGDSKLSGRGGEDLEGSVGPKMKQEMERLRQRQAELRNTAERLNLKYQLGSYDSFKMLQAVAIMRRTESDLRANRYENALRRKDVLLDTLDNSRTLVGGRIAAQHDTTPTGNRKLQQEIHDAMEGSLPPAWEGALKEYYRKVGQD